VYFPGRHLWSDDPDRTAPRIGNVTGLAYCTGSRFVTRPRSRGRNLRGRERITDDDRRLIGVRLPLRGRDLKGGGIGRHRVRPDPLLRPRVEDALRAERHIHVWLPVVLHMHELRGHAVRHRSGGRRVLRLDGGVSAPSPAVAQVGTTRTDPRGARNAPCWFSQRDLRVRDNGVDLKRAKWEGKARKSPRLGLWMWEQRL
jgi:hypothetical protein